MNQAGFSAIEVVIVLVVVGLLSIAGIFVYKSQHKTTSASKSATVSSFGGQEKVAKLYLNYITSGKYEDAYALESVSMQTHSPDDKTPSEEKADELENIRSHMDWLKKSYKFNRCTDQYNKTEPSCVFPLGDNENNLWLAVKQEQGKYVISQWVIVSTKFQTAEPKDSQSYTQVR
jgi:prepilin-type N-terminal cleavage/methylation domain-containing protein